MLKGKKKGVQEALASYTQKRKNLGGNHKKKDVHMINPTPLSSMNRSEKDRIINQLSNFSTKNHKGSVPFTK